jgi:hypothetical protein
MSPSDPPGLGYGARWGSAVGGQEHALVVDLDHWSVGTRSEALELGDCEQPVFTGLAILDPEVLLHRIQNVVGSADEARGCGAHLHVKLADRVSAQKKGMME